MSSEHLTHSVTSAKERAAKIRAEAAQREREQAEVDRLKQEYAAKQEAEARKVEDDDIEKASLLTGDETREQLHDYIRKMREEKPAEPPPPPPRTEGMMKELNAEQEAGRAAVAKAEAANAYNREAGEKARAEQAAREGSMVPVFHPNPSQDQQYPAAKATLGKPK